MSLIPGHDCFSSTPALSDNLQTEMLRILRVFYLLPIGPLLKSPPTQTPIVSQTFFPSPRQQAKISNSENRRASRFRSTSKKKMKMESFREVLVKANEFMLDHGKKECWKYINLNHFLNLHFFKERFIFRCCVVVLMIIVKLMVISCLCYSGDSNKSIETKNLIII